MMQHLNGEFTPNTVLDFRSSTLKLNRLSEVLLSTQQLAPQYDNKRFPEFTIYLSEIWFEKPTEFDVDEYGMYVVDREEVSLFDEDTDENYSKYINTGIPLPTTTICLNHEQNLNIKSVYINLIDKIVEYVINLFYPNGYPAPMPKFKEEFRNYEQHKWDLDYMPIDALIGVGPGNNTKMLTEDELYNSYDILGMWECFYNLETNRFIRKSLFNYNTNLICMPSYANLLTNKDVIDAGNEVNKSLTGTRSTIIFEASKDFNKLVQQYINGNKKEKDGNDVFQHVSVICSDPRIINAYSYKIVEQDKYGYNILSYAPELESHEIDNYDLKNKVARKGFFVCNGQLKRFLVVVPGTVLKLIATVESVTTEEGTEEVLFWFVENSNQFSVVNGIEQINTEGVYDDSNKKLDWTSSNNPVIMNKYKYVNSWGEQECSDGIVVSNILKKVLDCSKILDSEVGILGQYTDYNGLILSVNIFSLENDYHNDYNETKIPRLAACEVKTTDLGKSYQ